VNEQRYKKLRLIGHRLELFTTIRNEGWIEVIKKNEKDFRMNKSNENCICITATGWINDEE
jgi:hypothetical protein